MKYNGDTVYVKGYNDTFKITIYENNNIIYPLLKYFHYLYVL